MVKKDILILGHARSGTGYMAHLFNYFGAQIGHENYRENGISSWLFVNIVNKTNISNLWGPSRRMQDEYKYIIQCVRDPINAVRSIYLEHKMHPGVFKFRQRIIKKWLNIDIELIDNITSKPSTPEDRAVLSYIYWNEIIKQQNPIITVQVENAVEPVKKFIDEYMNINKNDEENINKNLPSKKCKSW